MDEPGSTLFYLICNLEELSDKTIFKRDKKNAGPPEWRSRERWKVPMLGTGAQVTGNFTPS
jgi:hypothetical protein